MEVACVVTDGQLNTVAEVSSGMSAAAIML